MACSYNHCSSCSSCFNRSYAGVSCANRACSNWNNWNGWNCERSNCSSCNTCANYGCNHCHHGHHCNHCHHGHHCSACNNCGSGCSSCCDTWNCGRSGCGSSRNGFGLLKGVSGPYNCIIDGLRYPFYTGPCGPCACDCCKSCCDECCNSCTDSCGECCDPCCSDCCETCCEDCCCNATFTASTPVELAAGDCVQMDCTAENNRDFTATQDGIRIHRAGNYMVVYTVHVPANEAVSSRFILTLNGERIAASAADITSPADGSTNGYTMHSTLFVPADSLLKLVSLNPVSICQSPASNVFTLLLHRMDG